MMLDCYSSDNGMLAPNAFSSSLVNNTSMMGAAMAPPLAALRDMTERRPENSTAHGDIMQSDGEEETLGIGLRGKTMNEFNNTSPNSVYGVDPRTAYSGATTTSASSAVATPHGITDILGRKLAAAEAARQANLPIAAMLLGSQSNLVNQQQSMFPQSVNPLASQRHGYPDCNIGLFI